MFIGRFETSFSGKNRIILPKKLRMQLKEVFEVVLTLGLESELWGFTKKDWELEAEKRLALSLATEQGREVRRNFFGYSEIVSLDKQGRFVIPGSLSNLVKLSTEIVILGAGDHFEIWDRKTLSQKNHT